MADYLPRRESELVTWSNTFDQKINAMVDDIGLNAAQVAAFSALNTAWVNAYNAANDGGSRTPASIQVKNDAKHALIRGPGGIRQLVGIIQKHPETTNAMRAELGVTIPDEPSPIPIPSEAPEIDFMPTTTRTIRIRLHNENTLGHGKPPHVVGATIFSYIGETPPDDLNEWKFERNTTRTVIGIEMPASVASGTKVWFTAFWRNRKDDSGPATTPISTVVQYGGIARAA